MRKTISLRMMRKIIHIDMDAFFASIEQQDNPEYRGRPLAVGYAGERGVVAAASYEARKYGVHSAMASKTALARCPHLIFVPGRHDHYRQVSRQIMDIFYDYTDLVEPLSIDEAYLDVTDNRIGMPSATVIAREIKRRIRETTGLTASAGVSVNKFLSKIASDYQKPDGLFVITDRQAEAFVEQLPIEKFWGVGSKTAERMHRLGIHTGADLKSHGEAYLVSHFGKAGRIFHRFARAVDEREVTPERIRKSVGAENTFLTDLDDREELAAELTRTAEDVWRRVSKRDFHGRTVTLKVKYADFVQITRSRTLTGFVGDFDALLDTGLSLLRDVDLSAKKVRLLGLTLSNIHDMERPDACQLELDFGVQVDEIK